MERNIELIPGQDDVAPIADINVTPFIDIMLVLLIIFMVTAPLMLGGVHINLPKSGGTTMARPDKPMIVSLDAESRIFVDKDEVTGVDRHEYFKKLARESETGEVYVRGDGEVKYARMMELMGELGQAGFARVTLVTSVVNELPATPQNQANPAAPPSEGFGQTRAGSIPMAAPFSGASPSQTNEL